MALSETGTGRLYRKGLYLEYFMVGYNLLESLAAITFGLLASSIALVGFGLDSIVVSLSGLLLIWRLRQHGRVTKEVEERLEKRASRLVAVSFFILGLYVMYESIKKLAFDEILEPSLPGIVIAVISLIVMPVLMWQKYMMAKAINNRALVADSRETLACAFLSLVLLVGLGMNYFTGFWQAVPIVGLIIVVLLFREGWEGWKEAGEEIENDG